MGTDKKKSSKKQMDIKEELEFWNSYTYGENASTELSERFKKIRGEAFTDDEINSIFNNIKRIFPKEEQPALFLKIFMELPKKECPVSKIFRENIKKTCESIFEENHFDTNRFNCMGKEIWDSDAPEFVISNFIKDVKERLSKKGYSKQNVLAITYIWIVLCCRNYRLDKVWEKIAIAEKVFVEMFGSKKDKDIKECVERSIPKAIANGTYEKQFTSVSYLYRDDEKKFKEFEDTIKKEKDEMQRLLLQNKLQQNKIDVFSAKNIELESMLSLSQNECDRLNKELVLNANMLKYSENEFEHKFVSKQENLMSEVKNLIGIEIENIETVAEKIPEKDRERIQKCIQRMWKQIAKLGGE